MSESLIDRARNFGTVLYLGADGGFHTLGLPAPRRLAQAIQEYPRAFREALEDRDLIVKRTLRNLQRTRLYDHLSKETRRVWGVLLDEHTDPAAIARTMADLYQAFTAPIGPSATELEKTINGEGIDRI
jgi:hypothetical protein